MQVKMMMRIFSRVQLSFLFIYVAAAGNPAHGDTLDEVRERGYLLCGITENSPAFSTINENGERAGMDIDHCKTVSAAVFGKISVEYVSLTPHTAFTTLQSGGVDLFCGGASWTYLRDTALGLDFSGIYYYGGQGFIVHKDLGVSRVRELDGATVCVAQGTTNEQNLADYFYSRGLTYTALTFSDFDKGLHAYHMRRCDAFTTNRAGLAIRAMKFPDRDRHVILPDLISKEPQAAVVRQGDPRWRDIVFWSLNVRVAAEELNINQSNVAMLRANSTDPETRRLLGVTGGLGKRLGLSNEWAYNVIYLVGNYNDIWTRNFGYTGLERGLNALWTNGGLLFAVPVR